MIMMVECSKEMHRLEDWSTCSAASHTMSQQLITGFLRDSTSRRLWNPVIYLWWEMASSPWRTSENSLGWPQSNLSYISCLPIAVRVEWSKWSRWSNVTSWTIPT